MANLTKMAESLGVTIDFDLNSKQSAKKETIKNKENQIGYKRRTWLKNSEELLIDNAQQKTANSLPQFIKNDNQTHKLSLAMLRSNPLKIAQYIFELSRQEINNTTKQITRSKIMKELDLSKESVKTAINFLLKNSVLERVAFRIGKKGWSIYKLETDFFNELQKAYQTKTIAPLNSVLSRNAISESTLELDQIDISQLEHIGLKISHIYQLKTRNSPKAIQESIYHFAYGLKFKPKAKSYSDPLSVLMGVLRKGEVWIEASYRSTQEIAQEEINNNIKTQIERLQKLEEEAFVLAFAEWNKKLSEEEIESVLQKEPNKNDKFGPQKVRLRIHFKEKIWPSKQKEYLIQ